MSSVACTFWLLILLSRENLGWEKLTRIFIFRLFYGNFMRVIISSANFVDYDWHSIDNGQYSLTSTFSKKKIVVVDSFPPLFPLASLFQDFPLLSSNIPTPKHPTNNPTHTKLFSLPLFKFFQELNVPPSFLKGFMNYDFSLSEEIRLIFSKQGYWRSKNDSMELGGGMIGLAKAVKSLNFQKGGKWSIEATVGDICSRVSPFTFPRKSDCFFSSRDHQLELLQIYGYFNS